MDADEQIAMRFIGHFDPAGKGDERIVAARHHNAIAQLIEIFSNEARRHQRESLFFAIRVLTPSPEILAAMARIDHDRRNDSKPIDRGSDRRMAFLFSSRIQAKKRQKKNKKQKNTLVHRGKNRIIRRLWQELRKQQSDRQKEPFDG